MFSPTLREPDRQWLNLAGDERVLAAARHAKVAPWAAVAAGVTAWLAAWTVYEPGRFVGAGVLPAVVIIVATGALTDAWRSVVTTERVIAKNRFSRRELRLVDVADVRVRRGRLGGRVDVHARDGRVLVLRGVSNADEVAQAIRGAIPAVA